MRNGVNLNGWGVFMRDEAYYIYFESHYDNLNNQVVKVTREVHSKQHYMDYVVKHLPNETSVS